MKARRPKKRYAPKSDRETAAKLAAYIRDRFGVDGDASTVLLDFFAKHGTFSSSTSERERTRRMAVVPRRYLGLRAARDTYEVAVEKLAVEFGCIETIIKQLVPHYSRNGRPFLK